MFQPFELLKPEYMPGLVALGKNYLVSQTYNRAGSDFSGHAKTPIILSDYDDLNLARGHLNAVRNDRFAAIIDLNNPVHAAKLEAMLHPDSKYAVYWAIVRSVAAIKKTLDLEYKDHIRRYITRHTTWRVGSGETMRPNLETVFGELFLVIKYGKQVLRIKFEDIEK